MQLYDQLYQLSILGLQISGELNLELFIQSILHPYMKVVIWISHFLAPSHPLQWEENLTLTVVELDVWASFLSTRGAFVKSDRWL